MLPAGRDLTQSTSEVQLTVRAHQRERFDTYLQQHLGWKSRTKVQRLIRMGHALINGNPARAASRVGAGDVVLVRLPQHGTVRDANQSLPAPFWEDAYLLAVDKPAGRLVHPTGRTTHGTIINELHERYHSLQRVGRRPVVPRLCHRLDRETSGVLLVAKIELARRNLQLAFEADAVRKEYLAIVQGVPVHDQFVVDLPVAVQLDRTRATGNRLATTAAHGKASRTDFEVLASYADHAVVRCRPVTGRQNQIRVHLAASGHPILGDVGFGSLREDWQARGSTLTFPERALLHSALLVFPHPIWQLPIRLTAPPPADFAPFVDNASLSS